MSNKTGIDDVEGAIADILKEYGDVVFKATDEALGAGEKVLIKKLKSSSPKGKDAPGYKKGWKGKGKKYKLKRYVGNTKVVKGKKSDTIPLSNILEYGTKSKHQGLIKRTYESSVNEIASAIINEVKKEV